MQDILPRATATYGPATYSHASLRIRQRRISSARARTAAHRAQRHDAADGRAHDQAPRPDDGAAGLILCKPRTGLSASELSLEHQNSDIEKSRPETGMRNSLAAASIPGNSASATLHHRLTRGNVALIFFVDGHAQERRDWLAGVAGFEPGNAEMQL
jgi:hypothetical protein